MKLDPAASSLAKEAHEWWADTLSEMIGLRKLYRLNQRDFARILGKAQSNVGRVESGASDIRMPFFLSWAAALDCQLQADRDGRTVVRVLRWDPTFTRKLATVRQVRRISQAGVARALGVSAETITRLESRAQAVRVPIFAGYLMALGYQPALRKDPVARPQ
jgi:transcriptional regulator with XRE-family HTH domain